MFLKYWCLERLYTLLDRFDSVAVVIQKGKTAQSLVSTEISFTIIIIESLLSHKINNHISYVTTLKEGIYINYRENQDKNYKTRLCLKIKRLTNVFLNLSVFICLCLDAFLGYYPLINFFTISSH